jgi:nucleotide-binding universal stress UspA family protein
VQRILVATDLSVRSDRAVRRAAQLAKQHHAALSVVHVVDDDQPEDVVIAAERAATTQLELVIRPISEALNGRCEWRTMRGDPFAVLTGLIPEAGADLVVMGAHRKQLLKDVFVGTTVERVIRARVAPVLVASSESARLYSVCLAALDLSEISREALETAARLGLLAGTHLTILHVYDPMATRTLTTLGLPADKVDSYVASAALEAAQELTNFLAAVDLGGLPYRTRVRVQETTVGNAVIQSARDASADLVIIGTHGKGGLARLLLGSTAVEVLGSLETDVLVVPPRGHPQRGAK